MKLLKFLLLIIFLSSSVVLLADDDGDNSKSGKARSQDVVISGTVSSVDENRRLMVVAGKTIHMAGLGRIPFKRGQHTSVVTAKIQGKIVYLGKANSDDD